MSLRTPICWGLSVRYWPTSMFFHHAAQYYLPYHTHRLSKLNFPVPFSKIEPFWPNNIPDSQRWDADMNEANVDSFLTNCDTHEFYSQEFLRLVDTQDLTVMCIEVLIHFTLCSSMEHDNCLKSRIRLQTKKRCEHAFRCLHCSDSSVV